MTVRILAISFIFICTAVAWIILGGTVMQRTEDSHGSLRTQVGQLWGNPLLQKAPTVTYARRHVFHTAATKEAAAKVDTTSITETTQLEASTIDVGLKLDYRQKGLVWYSTYRVAFKGRYRIVNRNDESHPFTFTFTFPSTDAVYDNFHMYIGDREVRTINLASGRIDETFPVEAGATEEIVVMYESNGMEKWMYSFGQDVNQVRNFSLVMHTNFDEIDFPEHSISPTSKKQAAAGWDVYWQYSNLLSGVQIGITMPEKLNPGPWVSQVTFFAPVSLFLFFFLLFIFTTIRKIRLHPMNYFFISAAFFSFHLLLAYLVDHVSIDIAFILASIISILLVISYMRIVVGPRFAFLEVGLSQFIFLVVFSYTFFFSGYTGLTITVACVVTLFIVMQATARIDWEELWAKDREARQQHQWSIREQFRRQEEAKQRQNDPLQ
jgi:hypothetical protein